MPWVEEFGYTYPGRLPIKTWRYVPSRMPRIPPQLINCSVFLYPSPHAARAGKSYGGCGFLIWVSGEASEPLHPVMEAFSDSTQRDPHFQYVVTCAHVVERHRVIRLNRAGRSGSESKEINDWHFHETSDLAVAPVELDYHLFEVEMIDYAAITPPQRPSDPLDPDSEVGLGDDVFIVSRFIRHDGKQTNWPAVRFGNVSVLPRKDERIEVSGDSNIQPQEAYLIEARTTPGASGSPVFLHVPGWEQREAPFGSMRSANYQDAAFKSKRRMEAQRKRLSLSLGEVTGKPKLPLALQVPDTTPVPPVITLLGIAGGFMFGPDEQVAYSRGTEPRNSDLRIARNSGMEWCVPSWKLLELLNYPRLRELREQQRQDWKKDKAPPGGALS